jgi:hypothetical protein
MEIIEDLWPHGEGVLSRSMIANCPKALPSKTH